MSLLLLTLAELFYMFPKTNGVFSFLDKSLLHVASSTPVTTDASGNYTISDSVTESVWTVRNVMVVGLLTIAVFVQLFRGKKG